MLSPELEGKLDDEDKRDAESALPVGDADAPAEGGTSKLEAQQRQVRLLVQGKQEGPIDIEYLIDALCVIRSNIRRRAKSPRHFGKYDWPTLVAEAIEKDP